MYLWQNCNSASCALRSREVSRKKSFRKKFACGEFVVPSLMISRWYISDRDPISVQPCSVIRAVKCRPPSSFLSRFTLDTNGLDDHDDGNADAGMTLKNMLTRSELCEMRSALTYAFNLRLFARSLLLATPLSSAGSRSPFGFRLRATRARGISLAYPYKC